LLVSLPLSRLNIRWKSLSFNSWKVLI
jgi:hypothetical protein